MAVHIRRELGSLCPQPAVFSSYIELGSSVDDNMPGYLRISLCPPINSLSAISTFLNIHTQDLSRAREASINVDSEQAPERASFCQGTSKVACVFDRHDHFLIPLALAQ